MLLSLVLLLVLSSTLNAQDLKLRKFLQDFAEKSDTVDVLSTKYIAKVVHLRGDGSRQMLVYLVGPAWCGTGGCLTLILVPTESSYTALAEIGLAQQPIRVLETRSNGWHDLGIWVQGGGIQPGYEARISFDGTTYPDNPSIPPAQKINVKVAGRVVVGRSEIGIPLYPK